MSTFELQEHISLQPYNTLSVPVTTRWFVEANTHQQIQQALVFVKQQHCKLLILGGGSNLVLVDDFAGLTLKLNTTGIELENETNDYVDLSIAAGENWHHSVMYCVSQNWYGIENLALIPGSVGAAPIQNIGAYGVELTDCLHYLEAIEISTGQLIRFDHPACEFAYRESIFKAQLKDQLIITRVVLRLSKTPAYVLDYPALKERLSRYTPDQLSAQLVADTVIAIRSSKLPDPAKLPNAGSFFKNPIVDNACYQRLKAQHPALVAYPLADQRYKLAAGWLLEQAGWKGKSVDGFAMHQQQALVLTNPNKLSGQALLAFVQQVQQDIQQKYQIRLDIEPRIIR